MKFLCESCKTKYSIADEKVRGKILRIRCRTCQGYITIREQPVVVAVPVAHSSPLSAAFESALGGGDFGDGKTVVAAMPATAPSPSRAPPPPPVAEDEWHFSVDGAQEGPMPLRQLAARVAQFRPGDEVYVWREGFDDWLPPPSVPELQPLLRKLAPPPPIPRRAPARAASIATATAPVAAHRPAAVSAPLAAVDPAAIPLLPTAPIPRLPAPTLIDEGEPFAAQLAHKAALDAAAAQPAEAALFPSDPSEKLPEGFVIEEASRVVRLPLPLPMPRPAHPATVSSAFWAQRGPLSAMLPAVAPAVQALAPTASRGRGAGRFLLLAGAATALALVALLLLVVLRHGRGPSPGVVADDPTTSDNGGLFINTGAGGMTRTAVAGDPIASGAHAARVAPPAGAAGGTPSSPVAGPAPSQPPAASALGRLLAGAGDSSVAAPTLTTPQAMSEDALRGVVRNGEGSLELCYQNALRRNPGLGHIRVSVDVAISLAGRVTNVSLPPDLDPTLGNCMSRLVRNWSFPQNTKDYDFSFPVVFRSE